MDGSKIGESNKFSSVEDDGRGGNVAIYPCPQCGCQRLSLNWRVESFPDFLWTGHWRYFFVKCEGCDWIGPCKGTKQEAVYSWNRCSPEFYLEDWTIRIHQLRNMQLKAMGIL